jgi:hypothetical protein
LKRRDERLAGVLERKRNFILDASVDRVYPELRTTLLENGFAFGIISMDLSSGFLRNLYQSKGYSDSLSKLGQFVEDHEKFLQSSPSEIILRISDRNFPNRLQNSLTAAKAFLQNPCSPS